MKEAEDFELYDKDFDTWVEKGRESFGFKPRQEREMGKVE